MIVELGKVTIDTELDHKAHKQSIEKKTIFHCEEDEPVYWFTQPIAHEGRGRYFHLYYNKSGTVLQKIDSWDETKDRYNKIKKIKGAQEMCYFMRQEGKEQEFEYEWVEEKDFSAPVSENPITHWKKGDKESDTQILPKKKKRWGLF